MKADLSAYFVLVVEDDSDHALLIRTAFQRGDPLARVHVVRSAEAALAYLRDTGQGAGSFPPPDVIVLDINMPGIGGFGFLEWYALQPAAIQSIPVIVFTSSDDPDLARRCFALGAREFKEKPADFMDLLFLVRRVLVRWRPWRQDQDGETA